VSEDVNQRLERLEESGKHTQQAVERIAVAMEQLVEIRVTHNMHSQEISALRKASHEYGNKLQELIAAQHRICKLEAHEESREDEIKASFAKRDERMNNLSRLVYIGAGIVVVLQVILPLFLFRGVA